LLRGFIIQYSSHKKFNAAKLADLERGIKSIEAKSKRSISESILKELTHFKYEYNIIISPQKNLTIFCSGPGRLFLNRWIKQGNIWLGTLNKKSPNLR